MLSLTSSDVFLLAANHDKDEPEKFNTGYALKQMLTFFFVSMQHIAAFAFPYLQSTQDTPSCLISKLAVTVLNSNGDLNLNEKQIFLAKKFLGLTATGETIHTMTTILSNKNFFPARR